MMKVNRIAKLGVIAASFGLAAMSMGADKDLTIRVGTVLPSNSDASDLGKTWFAAGLDYKILGFGVNSATDNGFYSLSLDYYAKNDVRAIPLTVNYNVIDGNVTYFAGLGVASTKIPGSSEVIVATGEVGATLGLGNFKSKNVSLTGKYFIPTNNQFTGFGFYLGVKF